ncbi:hypothetical protein U9M48_021908 [Paspalum notatum var. saurae]|uniref:Uncharacterized protein n=1 Tax=Paspalum notatum var. saurae TaxID=547442 RepID=A0AAQ3TIR4_PASNO
MGHREQVNMGLGETPGGPRARESLIGTGPRAEGGAERAGVEGRAQRAFAGPGSLRQPQERKQRSVFLDSSSKSRGQDRRRSRRRRPGRSEPWSGATRSARRGRTSGTTVATLARARGRQDGGGKKQGGVEKTKAAAATGLRKVKEGTASGFQWIKDKCQNKSGGKKQAGHEDSGIAGY